MSSAEWRSRTLMPLHKHGDDTSYWNNSLFYASKEHKNVGESLEFDTSVEGVLGDVPHYKQLYERVFQVRRNELHFLLKRLRSKSTRGASSSWARPRAPCPSTASTTSATAT